MSIEDDKNRLKSKLNSLIVESLQEQKKQKEKEPTESQALATGAMAVDTGERDERPLEDVEPLDASPIDGNRQAGQAPLPGIDAYVLSLDIGTTNQKVEPLEEMSSNEFFLDAHEAPLSTENITKIKSELGLVKESAESLELESKDSTAKQLELDLNSEISSDSNSNSKEETKKPRLYIVDDSHKSDYDWMNSLSTIDNNLNKIIPNVYNVSTILENDLNWKDVFGFDEFKQKIGIRKECPVKCLPNEEWFDYHETQVLKWFQSKKNRYQISTLDIHTVKRSIIEVSMNFKFNSLKDELESLKWDGINRLDNVLTDYFCVEESRFSKLIGSKFFVTAVARAYEPGCKVDTLIVLEGSQGFKKSSALEIIAGKDRFSDTAIDVSNLGNRDCAMQCQGVWICELPEIDGLTSRKDIQKLKKFFRTKVDSYVGKWETYKKTVPRSFIPAGTCNKDSYLVDETGNRSIWPVKVTKLINLDLLKEFRDQLIAEAVYRYKNLKERFWLEGDEENSVAFEEQDERQQSSRWDSVIEHYILDLESVSVSEILAHIFRNVKDSNDVQIEKWRQEDQNEVARFLIRKGWKRKRVMTSGFREYKYFKQTLV